ncbi:MAG: hypothetical protein ACOCUH_03990 [Bacteriovoracia bacterium]
MKKLVILLTLMSLGLTQVWAQSDLSGFDLNEFKKPETMPNDATSIYQVNPHLILKDIDVQQFNEELDILVEEKGPELSVEQKIQVEEVKKKVNSLVSSYQEATEPEQTQIGKIAEKAGIFFVTAYAKMNRPFMFAGAFLRGYFEKKEKVDQLTDSVVQAWTQKALNWAKNIKDEKVEKLLLNLVDGQSLTKGELNLIIKTVPRLELDETDMINYFLTWSTGKYIVPSLIFKALNATVLKSAILKPLMVVDLLGMISGSICGFVGEEEYNSLTQSWVMTYDNQNMQRYCANVADILFVNFQEAKIKGYLKGKNAKRRHLERKAERKERRAKRKEQRRARRAERRRH